MKKATFIILGSFAALVLPTLATAQIIRDTPVVRTGYIDSVVGAGRYYLGVAVTVLMVLMTLWFLWSVFKYIGEKDPKARLERRGQVVAGLIGLFIAVGVWGIIKIATRTAGVDPNASFGITCPPGYYYDSPRQACLTR
jgi:hypothetical protein